MSSPTPDDVSDVRMKAAEVEFRAKSDEAFLSTLKADPERVLKEYGIDDPMAQRLAAELRGDDAQGARISGGCGDICDPWTCIITSCCWFTTVEPTDIRA